MFQDRDIPLPQTSAITYALEPLSRGAVKPSKDSHEFGGKHLETEQGCHAEYRIEKISVLHYEVQMSNSCAYWLAHTGWHILHNFGDMPSYLRQILLACAMAGKGRR